MRTAPSSPAVAMRACPGCQAIVLIGPLCTSRRRIGWPSSARRTSTTPAAVPTASSVGAVSPGDRARELAHVDAPALGLRRRQLAVDGRHAGGARALLGGHADVGRAGSAAERAIDRVPVDVQQLLERQLAVAGAADARGPVDRAQPALHRRDLARARPYRSCSRSARWRTRSARVRPASLRCRAPAAGRRRASPGRPAGSCAGSPDPSGRFGRSARDPPAPSLRSGRDRTARGAA